MSHAMLGWLVIIGLVVALVVGYLHQLRRMNRMTPAEQQQMKRKRWQAGRRGDVGRSSNGGCSGWTSCSGAGCGGGGGD